MTRINAGFPPSQLNTKMLIAEHREIKRIPNMVASGRVNLHDIPLQFTLGPGHVKFFYNKLAYLLERYNEIYNECMKRSFKVTCYRSAWDRVPVDLMGDWECTDDARRLIEERIKERSLK